jgi:hypothetical protein
MVRPELAPFLVESRDVRLEGDQFTRVGPDLTLLR